MKWIETKIILQAEETTITTDLVANLFHETGLKGVVIEDPFPDPETEWATNAPAKPGKHAVTGFFPMDDHFEKTGETFKKRLAKLGLENSFGFQLVCREIDEEDWADSWKAHFHTIKIGNAIVVKPTWQIYHPQKNDIVVEIDPGMAFGTGTHPTTEMCIELLEKYIAPGDTILDVGTGSGILLIVSAKLGASKMWGLDIDPVAIKIAAQNLIHNQIDQQRYHLLNGSIDSVKKKSFSIIVANIISETIISMLDSVGERLNSGGVFICSGIAEASRDVITASQKTCGFKTIELRQRENWIAMVSEPSR